MNRAALVSHLDFLKLYQAIAWNWFPWEGAHFTLDRSFPVATNDNDELTKFCTRVVSTLNFHKEAIKMRFLQYYPHKYHSVHSVIIGSWENTLVFISSWKTSLWPLFRHPYNRKWVCIIPVHTNTYHRRPQGWQPTQTEPERYQSVTPNVNTDKKINPLHKKYQNVAL